MKRILSVTVLLLMAFTVMDAQSAPGGQRGGGQRVSVEERAKMTTEWMIKELNLTSRQIAPVDSLNLLFAKAQQIILQSSEGDREKIRETMLALEKEKETAFFGILTSEQLELYKKKRDEMAVNRRRRQ